MHLCDIQVKQNVLIIARERGKIVRREQGHNIFLNVGREWISKVISYDTLPAIGVAAAETDAAESNRIRYFGFGIGSTAQVYPAATFTTPPLDVWGATFTQTNIDPEVYKLETPVPISATVDPFPNDYIWMAQVVAPPDRPTTGAVRFSRILTQTEISFGSFALVPLSEIGLFTEAASYNTKPTGSGPMVAYETFSSIPKSPAVEIEIQWMFRF